MAGLDARPLLWHPTWFENQGLNPGCNDSSEAKLETADRADRPDLDKCATDDAVDRDGTEEA